jgi:hypothetical protein
MKKIKTVGELSETLFFDELDDGNVRFYLKNSKTNKGFAFDCLRDDKKALEDILNRNNVKFEVDDGGNVLPF